MKHHFLCTALASALVLLAACGERHEHEHSANHQHEQAEPAQAASTPVQVQQGITIRNAWVRPTVGEQDATGAYLTIVTEESLALVGVASPAAEIAELHEMKMEGDVMRMRMAQRIDIKPSEPLELKPGGYHVMLMALTGPINAGQEVELSLQFEKADGSRLEIPVKALAAQNTAGSHHGQAASHSH
ncbi:MAG TPA: copper chaperone PCu(A)C [Limnobacter sp.]|nr:copper chaperone PCu(A)C [Limnobacter sp.]